MSSSSYLIASSAINFYDFDKANLEFDQIEKDLDKDLSQLDMDNQLLTYVSLNKLSKANSLAKKIIIINEFNQEAWIVSMVHSIMNNDLNIFNKFKNNQDRLEMDLLNYIFFNSNGEIKDKKQITRSIFEIVQNSVAKSDNQIDYKFLLFYLSLAIIIDPNFNEAFFYKAQIYQNLEKYSNAEFFYKKISDEHNLFVESQISIALNKSRAGFQEKGIEILTDLLNNNKNNLDLMIALADLNRIQQKYDIAIDYYTKIINLKNNSFSEYWRIFYLRGICFERLQKWNLAEKDFLYSLKIKSNSPQVLNYLAYGWLERNLYLDKAMIMLKKAYQANPNSHYIADSLAWAFYKKNDLFKAVNLMEKVILMAPGEAISLYHLGDIYFAMNRKREASYYWKQALDLAEPEDEIMDQIIKKLEIYNAG